MINLAWTAEGLRRHMLWRHDVPWSSVARMLGCMTDVCLYGCVTTFFHEAGARLVGRACQNPACMCLLHLYPEGRSPHHGQRT